MLRSPMEGLMLSIQLLKEKVFAALMKKVCLGVREKGGGGGGGACLGFFVSGLQSTDKSSDIIQMPPFPGHVAGTGACKRLRMLFCSLLGGVLTNLTHLDTLNSLTPHKKWFCLQIDCTT